jgi:hypothetical protein
MEVFCWNPAKPAEPLDAFNQRLEDYCVANPVLDIAPSVALGIITISLTDAADAEVASAACLIPRLIAVPADQIANAERFLGAEITTLKERDTEEDPYIPFRVSTHDVGGHLLALVLIGGGELEIDETPSVDDPNTGAIPPSVRGGKR